MVLAIIIAGVIGTFIGTIVTRILIDAPLVGTIHIEDDVENGGEKYYFSFDSFDAARRTKQARLKIVDHTTR